MIQIAHMSTFVAVVETGSFTESARRLLTTKSVISRRVSEMEAHLGVLLLDRNNRRVESTEVGGVFYAKCVRILESIEAAENFVSGFNDRIVGALRFAVPYDVNDALISDILCQFSEAHPEIVLDVDVDDGERIFSFSDFGFDAGVAIGDAHRGGLIVTPAGEYKRTLCASPGYLSTHGSPDCPADLVNYQGLINTIDDASGKWLLLKDEQLQAYRVRERMRSNSYRQLVTAAQTGLGIVLAPTTLVAAALSEGGLQELLPTYAPPPKPVVLVHHPVARNSRKIQTLLSFIGERIKQ